VVRRWDILFLPKKSKAPNSSLLFYDGLEGLAGVTESRLRRPSSVGTTQSGRVCVSLVGFCGCCGFWADWFVMGFPSWWSSLGLEGCGSVSKRLTSIRRRSGTGA
jgi:hypothetical protein